jgi:PiT family inorganic phosphate transporter
MPAVATVATLLLATTGSLFMAWTIGAGSSGSTPFAPAVGANAISIMRAAFLVGILGLLGAVFDSV